MKHFLLPVLFLVSGLSFQPVSAAPIQQPLHSITEEIPTEILVEVLKKSCPHFERCLSQMIDDYKSGEISVEKIETGQYRVEENGGDPIVIVIDSF